MDFVGERKYFYAIAYLEKNGAEIIHFQCGDGNLYLFLSGANITMATLAYYNSYIALVSSYCCRYGQLLFDAGFDGNSFEAF